MVKDRRQTSVLNETRLKIFVFFILLFGAFIFLRLFTLQVLGYQLYNTLASGQQEIFQKLFPERGEILSLDRYQNKLVPLATNKKLFVVFAEPKKVVNPEEAAEKLAVLLELPKEEIEQKLTKKNDPYEPLKRWIPGEMVEKIKDLEIEGISFSETLHRFYPEENIGSHVIGFLGEDENGLSGRYGIEEYFDEILKGVSGSMKTERDSLGRLIAIGQREIALPEKGADVVLTIDRTIQYFACNALNQAVLKHGADGGTVTILEPKTGKILAMCSNPDFDLNSFSKVEDLSIINNQAIFAAWEPGSIFKTITMAAALDTEKITPETSYEDKGYVSIPPHTLKNADHKVYGQQDMTAVLENSINTGAVFAFRETGIEAFEKYVEDFGFGEKTGIELPGEANGDISSLSKKGKIFGATASFGQGITATPLQMAIAYAAIANGGELMKPYIVDQLIMPDGKNIGSSPKTIRRVISPKTSILLKSMLAMVVKEGHGKRAGVKGYVVAGKTGTAQVAKKEGKGYEEGIFVGSFVGFAPLDDPRFVMITRIDNPKDVIWAESSAAPLFGEIAKFLLEYLEVAPEN